MEVPLGSLDIKMPQQFLDVLDIYSFIEQMNSIAGPEDMKGHILMDACLLDGSLKDNL
jgi:hypothetical protein